MAFSPIAFVAPNFRNFSTYWVKPYTPGTPTPKPFALESDGGTQVAKLEINTDGFLKSAGGALVIPYIDGSYDMWMFPNEAEADANNTTNAHRIADDITGVSQAALDADLINDLSQAYEFATVAEYKAFATAFPEGKIINLLDRNAKFTVIAGIITADEFSIIQSDQVSQSVDYVVPVIGVALKALGATVSPADNGLLIQAAIDLATLKGTVVLADDVVYRSTIPHELTCQIVPITGEPEFEYDFGATPQSHCMTQTVGVDNIGFKVSAALSTNLDMGYRIDLNSFAAGPKFTVDVSVSDIRNDDNTRFCYGVLAVAAVASSGEYELDIKCKVRNIQANAAPAKGILVSINKSGMKNTIQSIDSNVSGVYPVDDGDGIHFTSADHLDDTQLSVYRIIRPVIRDCAKRLLKTQVPNCQVINPFLDATLADGSMATIAHQNFGVNCTVTSPTLRNESTSGNGDGFQNQGVGFVLTDPNISAKRGRNFYRMSDGGTYSLSGGTLECDEVYTDDETAVYLIEGGTTGEMTIPKTTLATTRGGIIKYQGSVGDHGLTIPKADGCAHLVKSNFGSGKLTIEYMKGSCASDAIDAVGTDQTIFVKGSNVECHAGAFIKADCRYEITGPHNIECGANGFLSQSSFHAGNVIDGNIYLESMVGAGSAVAINGSTGARTRGVTSKNFTTHINLSFVTDCITEGNVAVGGGTAIVTSGGSGNTTQNNMTVAT